MGVHVVHDILCLGLHVPPGVAAVGVELKVRDMHHLLPAEVVLRGVTLGESERLEGVDVVARVSEVVAVQVHRVGEAEVFVRLDEPLHDLRRGDIEVRDRVVNVLAVQPPSPGFGAAGVDDLDAEPPGGPEEPGGVCGVVLDLVIFQVFEGEPVVPEDRHRGVVDDRGIPDLFVDVGGMERGHRRLVDEDVTHPGVVVAGLECGGDRAAHLHAAALLVRALEEFILRAEEPADVHLRPDHVGVDIDAARHHGHSCGVDYLWILKSARLDDLTVLDADIHPVALDPLQGVKDEPVLD